MARGKKWPSKLWSCIPFLALNLYLFIGFFGPLFLRASGGPARRAIVNFIDRVFMPIYLPPRLLDDKFVQPIAEALHVDENLALYLGLLVASCELAAAVVGLLFYGAAALVYAIVPGERQNEQEADDASR